MERIIDVTTARRQFGTLLDEVFYKKDIITIERKGKPLAQIIPFEDTNSQNNSHAHLSLKQKNLLEELHSLPVISIEKDPTQILRKYRQKKKVQAKLNC